MNRLVIFDVDDTIFHDDIKHTVTYTDEGLFNFSSYHCSKTFSQCKPMLDMIDKVNVHLSYGDEVYFVTARSGMDDLNIYIKTFHDAGINIPVEKVIFAGLNQDNDVATHLLKKPVFEDLISSNIWNEAIIYDDNKWNLYTFSDICLDYDTPCQLWWVSPNKEGPTKLQKIY